jgi:hypothetical protein
VCVGGSTDFRNHQGFFEKGCLEHSREWYDMMKRYKQKHPWTSRLVLPCLSLYMLLQFLGLEITSCSIFSYTSFLNSKSYLLSFQHGMAPC